MNRSFIPATNLLLLVASAGQLLAGTISSAAAMEHQTRTGVISCAVLPPINPNKSFVQNFYNACYALKMSESHGQTEVGDLNATYNEMFYRIQPGYSLVVLGSFPNTRFMSATVYDDHLAIVGQLLDTQILPLTAAMINPLLPGQTYVPNQLYGIGIDLGGGSPLMVAPGCATSPRTTIDRNSMDASQIHSGLTWLGYPNLPLNFVPHEIGPNASGLIEIRKYVDISSPSTAVVIVRQLSNGCALPAPQAISMKILAPTQPNPSPWLHENQMSLHKQFAGTVLPTLCFPSDPLNSVVWTRTPDYVPIYNGANASVQAKIAAPYLASLLAGKVFLRVQFRLPTTPSTPCVDGCLFTGFEDQRYKSLSLQNAKNTLVSLKDSDFVTDAARNVTLIVSLGAVTPPQVTAAHYYTYLDLTKVANYQELQSLFVRDILPSEIFLCSGFNVPFKTMAYNPEGGYMGPYNMTVDFPSALELPTFPVPTVRPDSCSIVPAEVPVSCPAGV